MHNPKFFRLVFSLDNNETCKQLQSYKLKGVRGISASGAIIYQFLGVARDAALVMPAKQVLALNKHLVEIKYDDPKLLLANNMLVAKRIFNKSGFSGMDNQNILFDLLEYMLTGMAQHGMIRRDWIRGDAPHQTMSYTKAARNSKINSVGDFIKMVREAAREAAKRSTYSSEDFLRLAELDDTKLKKAVNLMAQQVKQVYGDEREWFVPNGVLNIPKSSILFILLPGDAKSINDLKDFIKKQLQSPERKLFKEPLSLTMKYIGRILRCKLYKFYKTKFISRKDWNRIQKRFFDIRYNKQKQGNVI